MKTIAFYILAFCMLTGCATQDRNKDNVEQIKVNLTEARAQYFDSIFAMPQPVYFDQNAGLIVGEIEQVILTDSLVIINDGCVKIFNSDGALKKEIDRKGEGPQEYIKISGINSFENKIYLLDTRGRKVLKFDNNGNVDKVFSIGLVAQAFSIVNDSTLYFFHGYNPHKYGCYNVSRYNMNNDRVINYYIPYKKYYSKFMHFYDVNNFFFYNNCYSLAFSGSNMMYYISEEGELKEKVHLDFGVNSLSEDLLEKDYFDVMEFSKEMKKKNVIYKLLGTWETSKHLVFGIHFNDKVYLCIHSKKDNKTTIVDKLLFRIADKTIPVNISYYFLPKAVLNDQLIFVIEPSIVSDIRENLIETMVISNTDLEKSNHIFLSKNYTPVNNPFLLKVKLK